jgi:CubicO group peptidase (beta-lactamase class C family)
VNPLVALLLSAAVAAPADAGVSPAAVAKLDRYLIECYERLQAATPGFAVVVVDHDRVVFAKGFGVEAAGGGRRFTADSVCPVGSLTKSFTAVGVLQLVERGKVELDAPVVRYLPWFRTADRERSDRITVRMLLSHTSGLPSRDQWMTAEGSAGEAMELAIRPYGGVRAAHEPGESFEYSNEGYTILGLIMERVTGTPYCDYLESAVLGPLGMGRSTADEKRLRELGALTGHSAGIDRALPGRLPYVAAGAPAGSTFASTARDLGRYLIALLNRGKIGDTRILSSESVALMMKPAADFPCPLSPDAGGDGRTWHYGMGWMIADIDGRRLVFHEGDTGHAGSMAVIDPARSVGVCIVRNSSDVDPHRFPRLETMANNVLHMACSESPSEFGVPRKPDETLNDYRPPRELALKCVGTYVSRGGNIRITVTPYPGGDGLRAETVSAYIRTEELVDFRDESLVVLRSVRDGRRGLFRKLPDGEVVGLELGGEKFRRVLKTTPDGYQVVRSPDSRTLVLPAGWSVDWQGANFTAADPADRRVVVRGGIFKDDGRLTDALAEASHETGAAVDGSPLMSSAIGGTIWRQQPATVTRGDDKWQRVIAYTRLDDRIFFVALRTPPGGLTKAEQRLLLPLLSALGSDPDFASAWSAVHLSAKRPGRVN